MSEQEKGLAVVGDRGVQLHSLGDAMEFATLVAKSKLAPKGMDTPEQVLVAVQTGMELGLTPMRALQTVVVVNGRATLMGEGALALVRASGLLAKGTDIELGCRQVEGEDRAEGYCRSRRTGGKWQETSFTVADARKAGLWGKSGPWAQYPKRMLMWRSVAFHIRDYWSDVTHGLRLADEARDMAPRSAEVRSSEPGPRTVTGRSDPLLSSNSGQAGPQDDDDIIDADFDTPEEQLPLEPGEEIDPETGEVIPNHIR